MLSRKPVGKFAADLLRIDDGTLRIGGSHGNKESAERDREAKDEMNGFWWRVAGITSMATLAWLSPILAQPKLGWFAEYDCDRGTYTARLENTPLGWMYQGSSKVGAITLFSKTPPKNTGRSWAYQFFNREGDTEYLLEDIWGSKEARFTVTYNGEPRSRQLINAACTIKRSGCLEGGDDCF